MSFSYKPLWKTLVDKNLSKKDLRIAIKASPATIAKMSRDEFVAMDVLDRICNFLDCEISDVVQHIKDKK